jgi:hypothetical protein
LANELILQRFTPHTRRFGAVNAVKDKNMVLSALILVSLIAILGTLPGWPKAEELRRNPVLSGLGLIVVVTLILVAVL